MIVVALLAIAAASGWWGPRRQTPTASVPLPPAEPAVSATTQTQSTVPISVATGSRIGERAPEFTLPSLSGQTVSLSQFRGRVVILDFWASWCAPCRSTMPNLHTLWRDLAARGVDFVGVSLDRTASAATSYLSSNGFGDMIALWGSLDAAQTVASLYGVRAIPRTIVIDRKGIVRFNNHSAMLDRTLLESLL